MANNLQPPGAPDPEGVLRDLFGLDSHWPTPANRAAIAAPNNTFENLLEAARTAGEDEVAKGEAVKAGQEASYAPSWDAIKIPPVGSRPPTRKRRNDDGTQQKSGGRGKGKSKSNGRSKRAKKNAQSDENLARERELWGDAADDDGFSSMHNGENDEDNSSTVNASTPQARDADIPSTVALFKDPTPASKKYARPPMAKIFKSMDLTTEEFISFQTAAKTFMLDEKHPERNETVGDRSRNEGDLTKLRLFNCVKEFLDNEGWGERVWGQGAANAASKKLKWPESMQEIVNVVTPLLRRIISNERQRVYATEVRSRPRQTKSERAQERDLGPKKMIAAKPADQESTPSTPSQVDPTLNHHLSDSSSPHVATRAVQTDDHFSIGDMRRPYSRESSTDAIHYLVNVYYEGEPLSPRVTLNPYTCPGFPSLLQHIQIVVGESFQIYSIKALTSSGLVDVNDDDSWREVVGDIRTNEWMDGELRVVVEAVDRSRPASMERAGVRV